MKAKLKQKLQNLFMILQKYQEPGLLIAFSGGVDSTVLAAAAQRAGLSRVELATCHTLLHSQRDLAAAKSGAAELGLPLHLLEPDVTRVSAVMENRRERCYACKRLLFSRMRRLSMELGLGGLAEGSNSDDLAVVRPGLKAGTELSVSRPLAEAELNKAEVRALAQEWGLSCHDRPANPCLASRFPYDVVLSRKALRQVEAGEDVLAEAGLSGFRLRYHGDLARIECQPEQIPLLLEKAADIAAALKERGFRFITHDLEGFRSGSFDC